MPNLSAQRAQVGFWRVRIVATPAACPTRVRRRAPRRSPHSSPPNWTHCREAQRVSFESFEYGPWIDFYYNCQLFTLALTVVSVTRLS